MAFADSFTQAYHFRLLYMARALMYPIMGAMRYTYGQQWEVGLTSTACSMATKADVMKCNVLDATKGCLLGIMCCKDSLLKSWA